jgi:site-specific recombinase XerD
MISIRKRGKTYHADFVKGKKHPARGSLGTHSEDAARRLTHRLETALSEGPNSSHWSERSKLLPRGTFLRFASLVGATEKQLPTWEDLLETYKAHMAQRVKLGKFAQNSVERYSHTLKEFELFLAEQRNSFLRDIGKPLIESFKVWRLERIKKRKHSRDGSSLSLDAAILHRTFSFAIENEMIEKNPVRLEGRPGENPEGGAEPFSSDELFLLRKHAEPDLLSFLMLRWTGPRGSDAVKLTWAEVYLDRKEIERVTQKRRKKVILPIHTELLFALELERDRRHPKPTDRVLLNPTTGKPMTRPRLYQRIQAMGRRAGVPTARPHRFRDTLAVDMLTRGASPYDVAKMLGDTIETVEKHYTPFVKELRERVRNILETGVGLEELGQKTAERPQITSQEPN